MEAAPVVGLDVAKAWIDVALLPEHEQWHVTQCVAGLSRLAARLLALAPKRIVVEATGGYDHALVDALGAADLPVVVVNPRRVRRFGQAIGPLAKSDRLDARLLARYARLLARYGQQVQPPLRALPSSAQRALPVLVVRRRQLLGQRVAETNRLALATVRVARAG